MKVELLEHTPEPERVIAAAAKLCYSQVGVDDILEKMTPEKCESFIEMFIGNAQRIRKNFAQKNVEYFGRWIVD